MTIGLSELFGRRMVGGSSVLGTAFLMQLCSTLAALASLPLIAGSWVWFDLGWGVLSGLGMAAGHGLYFTGLVHSSSAVVAPTVATLSAVVPYAYAMVRGSESSPLGIVGAAMAFAGLAAVAAGTSRVSRLRQGLVWGTLSGLGYGVGISLFIEVGDSSGAWPAVSQRAAATVAIVLVGLLTRTRLVPPVGVRRDGLIAGWLMGLTSIGLVIGLRIDAPATVVTSSMFPVVSVVLGFWYFNDSVSRRQVVGIALALAGIGLVVGS